jgi:heme-degrading monooxygenase HmoA
MFARLTFINLKQNKIDEFKSIFNEEVVPAVKNQKGNLGIWLLEPTDINEDYISLTEWVSKADAEAYDSSGTYKALVNKIREDLYKSKPFLKTYNIAETKIMVPM